MFGNGLPFISSLIKLATGFIIEASNNVLQIMYSELVNKVTRD